MIHDRTAAAFTLLRALLDARAGRRTEPPPTLPSERESVSPFTLREGLFHEPA